MPNIDLRNHAIEIKSLILYHYFLLNNCHFFFIYRTQIVVISTFIENRPCFSFNKIDLRGCSCFSLFCLQPRKKKKTTTTVLNRRMTCHVFVFCFLKICRPFYFSHSYFYVRISVSQLYFLYMIKENKEELLLLQNNL
jgi:hypothetical protein